MTPLLDSKKLLEGVTPEPWDVPSASFRECGENETAYHIKAEGMGMSAVNARLIAASPRLAREHAAMKEALAEVLPVIVQYRDDLRRPPEGDSIDRRLDMAEASIKRLDALNGGAE